MPVSKKSIFPQFYLCQVDWVFGVLVWQRSIIVTLGHYIILKRACFGSVVEQFFQLGVDGDFRFVAEKRNLL